PTAGTWTTTRTAPLTRPITTPSWGATASRFDATRQNATAAGGGRGPPRPPRFPPGGGHAPRLCWAGRSCPPPPPTPPPSPHPPRALFTSREVEEDCGGEPHPRRVQDERVAQHPAAAVHPAGQRLGRGRPRAERERVVAGAERDVHQPDLRAHGERAAQGQRV